MSLNRITYWNCAGGIKSKLDYIKQQIANENPCVFFISESELKTDDLNLAKIRNYDLITALTINKGPSRVACYIKSNISYKVVPIKDHDLDIIAIETRFERVIGLYRGFKLPTGKSRTSFFDTILESLKNLVKTTKLVTIGGDFNVDLFTKSANLNDLDNWSIRAGLDQLVDSETRQRLVNTDTGQRLESSAIDHVYTNVKEWKLTIEPSISDHHLISVTRPAAASTRQPREKIFVRDWRNYNQNSVNEVLNDKMHNLQISSTLISFEQVQDLYRDTLNEIAPLRVVKIKEGQIVSPKLESLKKRRDRYLKKYKKSRDLKHLDLAKSFTYQIKKTVKTEARRIFQCKVKSKDPKDFWSALGDKMGKHHEKLTFLEINGEKVDDKETLSNNFAEFFLSKVQRLSQDPITMTQIPFSPISFSFQEVEKACKSLNNKRSYGVDGIPQNLVKDTFGSMGVAIMNIVNEFGSKGMPDSTKMARVQPLHKKGSKHDINNYRPISNLSVFSKIYEKCILARLLEETNGLEGSHQHGFRKYHSTETALLMVQSEMANLIDSGDSGIIYSVDLSAAFDLLRPDKFFEIFKNKLSEPLLCSIMDFLSKRTFKVEIDAVCSTTKELDRGCVQGSILGPRLFSLYVGELCKHLQSPDKAIKVISYADDTYVIVRSPSSAKVVKDTEETAIKHVGFLRNLGMVVNEDKTEIMWIGKTRPPVTSIKINNSQCEFKESMKALGIFIQGNLAWDKQSEQALLKGKRLVSCMRYLRKYLTEEQFLRAATANYFSSVFYASSVWFDNIKASYRTKFDSLHFRMLRIATKMPNDTHRRTLYTRCNRATPVEWSRYITATKVIKIIRDQEPKPLFDLLSNNYFEESRKPEIGFFFDNSRTLAGKQSIQNRLMFMRCINDRWNNKLKPLSNDQIRVIGKKAFFDYYSTLSVSK